MTPGFIERSLFAFSIILTIGAIFALMPSGATMPVGVVGVSIVAAWVITVLAHESGHVVVGNLVGFRLREVAVGPIRVMWNGASFHLGRNRRNPLAGYSISLPIGGEHITRRLALTTVGGPAGNLVLAIVAWLLLLAITDGHPHSTAASPAEYFLSALAVFSFIYVPANLLPFRGSARGFVPDGRQIITYLINSPARHRQEALALLNAQDQILGKLPEDWDEGAIQAALSPRDGSLSEMNALYFAYMHARDSGWDEQVMRYLDDLIAWRDAHPESRWNVPYVLRAVAEAEQGNIAAAREWQGRAGPRTDQDDRHLMEGAIRLAEGDTDGAAREIDLSLGQVRTAMEQYGTWGSIRSAERRLLRMRQLAQEQHRT